MPCVLHGTELTPLVSVKSGWPWQKMAKDVGLDQGRIQAVFQVQGRAQRQGRWMEESLAC